MTPEPVASIIVLFLPGSPWVAGCLEALERMTPADLEHEVIVLANGGLPGAPAGIEPRAGRTVLHSTVNLGFAGGCNWAARSARGRYLVFLNDDTTVEEGWLQALIGAAESESRLGAVGSLVLGADGTVGEAGRVLWRDGPSHPLRSVPTAAAGVPPVQYVDYCSACALLVRRRAWESAGGFDERYFPAYFEDADLSLELQMGGWKVACAPASRVRHQGSASTSVLWRRFLGIRNHELFVSKWLQVLPAFPDRPRDRPTSHERLRVAAAAERRQQRIYHRFGVNGQGDSPSSSAAERTLAERQLTALRAELAVKDAYIQYLETSVPQLERGLQRVLRDERMRVRVRETLRAIPVLGAAARWLKRRLNAVGRG